MSDAICLTHTIPSGLAILQSNLPEELQQLLLAHIRQHPLLPLEEEVVLVQSGGIGRWLQLGMGKNAGTCNLDGGLGISASVRFELPARFLWRAYRTVLGEQAVPESSPFDARQLRWRLFGLLPLLIGEADFEPLRHYLERDDNLARRRWQLAGELAVLLEQYQIYRADWLLDWERGKDRVLDARGLEVRLDDRQLWQAALWRRLLATAPQEQHKLSRAHLHQSFIDRLGQAARSGESLTDLPRRVVVFGISSLPAQMVDALAALAEHLQVLICLHNPCRHYWADIIEGRDLLRSRPGKRLKHRPDWPAQLDDETVHQHANPLLAAWGRQGRDFFALLDDKDQPAQYAQWFDRIDLFEDFADDKASSLLQQIQQGILDLEPRIEDRQLRRPIDPANDRSLRFHAAHSPQREVEILHDQLLAALDEDGQLQPRDIIVMVPDIDAYAPHIEAVFGARGSGHEADPRHIPFSIADRRERLSSPTLVAFTRLLDLPRLRMTANEVIDLLSVPAVHRHFGIAPDQIERISVWLSQSGVRWGLHGRHRASLGLKRPFERFSWNSGIQRMLLGHASGEAEAFEDILPFDEVAGSEADLAGRLAQLIDRLSHHWQALQGEHVMEEWARRLRAISDDFLDLRDDADELAGYQLDEAVDALTEAAALAELDQSMPLDVVRDALIEQLDQGHVSHRFLAGKVNFSTLMPMRAIPFRMVCLLGMNDGDYPRTRKPADFDLMDQPGLHRPGDRSRREDDRYLFLEALLAARRRFYISWIGRSIHNDEKQPASVLVGQLRDHILGGWMLAGHEELEVDAGEALLKVLTIWHPLQPFSRRYFDNDSDLFTYAAQWRLAYESGDGTGGGLACRLDPMPLEGPLTIDPLVDFLQQPVKHFTRRRLQARLDLAEDSLNDTEPFSLDGLESWAIDDHLLNELLRVEDREAWPARLAHAGQRLAQAGRLPMGHAAEQLLNRAGEKALSIAEQWFSTTSAWPEKCVPGAVRLQISGIDGQILALEQWLPELRACPMGEYALITASATRLVEKRGTAPPPRLEKLVRHWPMHLLINAAGYPLRSIVVHQQGSFEWEPIEVGQARAWLEQLIQHWQEGLCRPLPVAAATASAYLIAVNSGKADTAMNVARKVFEDGYNHVGELSREPALGRWYPDFNSLTAAGGPGDDFQYWAAALYGAALEHWSGLKGVQPR